MTSKELRTWLEHRGVAVVTTRTDKRSGAVMATSCWFYGAGRAHVFRVLRDSTAVLGFHVNEYGAERYVGRWAADCGRIEQSPSRAAPAFSKAPA